MMWSADELRDFVQVLKERWERGEIKCPIHFPGGNEKELINIFKEVKNGDYVFSTHRNMYHYLLAGGDHSRLLAEIQRRKDGVCGGESGSMCTCDAERRFYSSAIVGGVCAIAVGVGWGIKERGGSEKVWCFIGDGALDQGHTYEAVRYAESWDLPVTFVIEDNDRSTCSSKLDRWGGNSIVEKGIIGSKKVLYYRYKATYPHVGSGKYIAF